MAQSSNDKQAAQTSRQQDELAPLRPSEIFANKRFVVIGGTGFLGKVWLSMFLQRFPEVDHIYLVVRPRGKQTSEERFWAEIAPSLVWDPLRERHPGAEFERFLREKITPVAGDVTKSRLGLSSELIEAERGRIAVVINVAGVVDFNPPLDEALDVNAFGVSNLIDLAQDLGAAVMHTSTCYVAGYRTGVIEEQDPRDVPFPRAEGAQGARLVSPPDNLPLDTELERSHWDPQNEIDECLDVIKHTRHRCEDQFRQSLFLDDAKRNLNQRGEPCRGTAVEEEFARVKRRFIRSRLVKAGVERAQYWGWPNIYTYTKSIGEQVLAGSGVPFTIVRPAVVESATYYPFPGWNEGINTSASYIYLALKGQVQFPNDKDVHLDIIPVDMVCSGMNASLAELMEGTHKAVYQYGMTDTNPCSATRFVELIGLYKRRKLQDGGTEGNRVINAILARVEPVHLSKQQYQAHGAHAIAKAERLAASVLDAISVGPMAGFLKPASRMLRKAAAQEDRLGDVMDVFLPFLAECDWIFRADNTRAAMARMPDEERARFYWAPEELDWREWMYDVHIPGIERWATPLFEERLRREIKPRRRYDHLIDLMDEMAERHQHAVALRQLSDDGLTRTTFAEWQAASASCAGRLAELGVKKGDRVVLCGQNEPAWAKAYFGIIRAGAVAVPLDPKLGVGQWQNVIESCGARVALIGAGVEAFDEGEAAEKLPTLTVVDMVALSESDTTIAPPEVSLSGDDLASVIYTSGTTGDPKGVMLSHQNLTSMLAALTPLFRLTPKDRVLSVLPLHHTFEFSCGLLLPMSAGASIHYLGEVTSERLSEGLVKGQITSMVGVPALWQMLERKIANEVQERGSMASTAFDWALELNRMLGKKVGIDAGKLFFAPVHQKLGGRVRYLISGGSALPQKTAKMFAGLGLELREGYGLTEAAPVLTVTAGKGRRQPGQVGKPIPGVELKIDKPNADGIGEVLARGPNVMRGYFGNDEASKAVVDQDGWLRTGDLGAFDKRGRLVLSGRSKDVIVSASGENVYPDDVEALISTVPHVEELTVLGLKRGESEVVACIAVPDLDADDRALVRSRADAALREAFKKLPAHARPAIVQLYDAPLPKTATRKVKRSEAREIIERLMRASMPPPEAEVAGERDGSLNAVVRAIAAIANIEPSAIAPTMSLVGDLGFDSLMSMELSVALEASASRSIDATELAAVETVTEIARLLDTQSPRLAAEIETVQREPVEIPQPVAEVAKRFLGLAQDRFYSKLMKPKVYGRAFIPHNRNTIVVSNHASHLDMGFLKFALGDYGRDVVGLAAADYFFDGRWRQAYFDQLTNLQSFERKTNLRQALRQASETIQAGKTVVLFPEGTRSTDGQIYPFKSTLGHLALGTATDILPMYLGGTFESWPKGRRVPSRRDISAHIGPPLLAVDLARLTEGMKASVAYRVVAELARAAVVALQRGTVLDLSEYATADDALAMRREHPLVGLFRELEEKFVVGRVKKPVTFYFSLGSEAEAKWTAQIDATNCIIKKGKPAGSAADCVLKTSAEIFTKMVREAYLPTPVEVMSGLVKSNDVGLLSTFQEAFDIR